MKGYKATDKDLKCKNFQFEIGKWYEHEGDLVECTSGFHFCEHPSGPWAYYADPGTRIFEIEADDVLEVPFAPGADFKRVARRIKLIKELTPGGDRNTGDRNTGDRNTGDRNTGDRNTGDGNTGDWNTGDGNTGDWNTGDGNIGNGNTGYGNTGDRNTGDRNTGYWNTGDWNIGNGNTGYGNTGDWNTGDRNTGYWNTGDRNTGDRNTGNRNTGNCNTGYGNIGNGNTGNGNTGNGNTGYGNATNFSTGFFCVEEPNVISFDAQTELTREEFTSKYPEYFELCKALLKDEQINFEPFKNIPGITEEKLLVLHNKFKDARKK